jgi:hypothetical protein
MNRYAEVVINIYMFSSRILAGSEWSQFNSRFTTQGKNVQQSLVRERSRTYLDSVFGQFTELVTQAHLIIAINLNNERVKAMSV